MASSSSAAAAVGPPVEEVRTALNEHADVVAELFGRVSTELRGGFAPAVHTSIGFFHAVNWKETWLIASYAPDTSTCGNSGGPLVNLDGQIIGVDVMKVWAADVLNFSVSDSILKIVEHFKRNGQHFSGALKGVTTVLPLPRSPSRDAPSLAAGWSGHHCLWCRQNHSSLTSPTAALLVTCKPTRPRSHHHHTHAAPRCILYSSLKVYEKCFENLNYMEQ